MAGSSNKDSIKTEGFTVIKKTFID